MVKSWLLAVPSLASLLSDCVQSNLTLEWAEQTLEPPPLPQSRPGLTLQAPEHPVADWCVVSFCLLDIFFIPRANQKYSGDTGPQVKFQVSLVTAICSFRKHTTGLSSGSICLGQVLQVVSPWAGLCSSLGLFLLHDLKGADWLLKSLWSQKHNDQVCVLSQFAKQLPSHRPPSF